MYRCGVRWLVALTLAVAVTAAAVGLAIGSFLDVVAYRLPRGLSLLRPASHCPGCDRALHWRENIPVASWLALRGHCHHCGAAIPLRVVLVEATTAVAFAGLVLALGHSWSIPGLCVLVASALAVAGAAADDTSLPAPAVVIATMLGMAALLVAVVVTGGSWTRLVDAGLGAVSGGLVTAAATSWSRHRSQGQLVPPSTVVTADPPEALGAIDAAAHLARHGRTGAVGALQVLLPAGATVGWFGARGALGALAAVALVGMVSAIVAARRRRRGSALETEPRAATRGRRLLTAIAGLLAMAGAVSSVPASTSGSRAPLGVTTRGEMASSTAGSISSEPRRDSSGRGSSGRDRHEPATTGLHDATALEHDLQVMGVRGGGHGIT